ncbi:hypothetical protein [Microbispora sp. NPDC049125]|uniref:hypothetical protein n=1 Tax=Microbispora sp. NPDC049125 TaxID=3154929 RepID=UPI0034652AAE
MTKPTDWYIADEDDGIIRRESTKAALLKWATIMYDGKVLPGKKKMFNGHYEYEIGIDRDNATFVSVFRGDALAYTSYDIDQEPTYPYADDPWQLGPRGLRLCDRDGDEDDEGAE